MKDKKCIWRTGRGWVEAGLILSSTESCDMSAVPHLHPKAQKATRVSDHQQLSSRLCCLCQEGLRGGRSTLTGDRAVTEGQACGPWHTCASFVTTALHLMTHTGTGLELVMAWSTFYLTQRTPHYPPPISKYTYKVCSFRETGLISNIFKDLNKYLQNILKNLCRGNLCVSSKAIWFLLLKIYWNS